jgi:hypothetical protein
MRKLFVLMAMAVTFGASAKDADIKTWHCFGGKHYGDFDKAFLTFTSTSDKKELALRFCRYIADKGGYIDGKKVYIPKHDQASKKDDFSSQYSLNVVDNKSQNALDNKLEDIKKHTFTKTATGPYEGKSRYGIQKTFTLTGGFLFKDGDIRKAPWKK